MCCVAFLPMFLGDEPVEQQQDESADDTYSPPEPVEGEFSRDANVITPVQEYGTFVVRPTSETTDFLNVMPQERKEDSQSAEEGVPSSTSAHEID